jgi:3,4-dihydroxy 2-butanone 4-phosphate synthase
VCNEDGSMARIPELLPFCEEHGLVLTSIADLVQYIEEVGVEAEVPPLSVAV